jgi:hypothetical protein
MTKLPEKIIAGIGKVPKGKKRSRNEQRGLLLRHRTTALSLSKD